VRVNVPSGHGLYVLGSVGSLVLGHQGGEKLGGGGRVGLLAKPVGGCPALVQLLQLYRRGGVPYLFALPVTEGGSNPIEYPGHRGLDGAESADEVLRFAVVRIRDVLLAGRAGVEGAQQPDPSGGQSLERRLVRRVEGDEQIGGEVQFPYSGRDVGGRVSPVC
jgi:hypothetical protein